MPAETETVMGDAVELSPVTVPSAEAEPVDTVPSGAVTVTTVGIACTVLTVKVQVSVTRSLCSIPFTANPVIFEPTATVVLTVTS